MKMNFSFIYRLLSNKIRSKNLRIFKSKWKQYKIIPFGCYCLPRVITTINGLKPSKKDGEKSYPFDLCFSKFDLNLDLLSNKFKHFYKDLEYEKRACIENNYCWVNNRFNLVFNHDTTESLKDFKQRYDRRIKNLYNDIKDENVFAFFIISTWNPITNEKINMFIKEIKKYRKENTFCVIVINQSNEKTVYTNKDIYCINLSKDKSFRKINKKGEWVDQLKDIKNRQALLFNNKVVKQLARIIKKYW